MRMILVPVVVAIISCWFLPAYVRAEEPIKKDNIPATLAELHARMDTALAKGDTPAAMNFFAADAVSLRDGKTLTRSDVERAIKDMLSDTKAVTVTSHLKHFSLGTDIVSVISARKFSITYTDPPEGMPQPLNRQIVQQETWRKIDGEWRLVKLSETPLTAALKEMARQDQEGRTKAIENRTDKALLAQMVQTDIENLARLKEIIALYGWPQFSQVGTEAGHDAWLIIQHADFDSAYQEKCLTMLKAAVKKGEADGSDLAYLTDRVRVNTGKLQVYGTQFLTDSSGTLVPRPMEDPKNVDKRRAAVGLSTMDVYKKLMASMYKQAVK